jgi:RNA polymerase-binding transcription factor DksA
MESMNADRARQRLLEERARIVATLAAARSMGEGGSTMGTDLSHVGMHPADVATDVADRQTAAALGRTLGIELHRIEAALARLDKGEHGRCEVCGREIEDERLEVSPAARTCIEHREQAAKLPEPV